MDLQSLAQSYEQTYSPLTDMTFKISVPQTLNQTQDLTRYIAPVYRRKGLRSKATSA